VAGPGANDKPTPWLFRWRAELLSERGPKPTTRFVLTVLATFGDEHGGNIFPSTRLLAEQTGLSRRAVETHLRTAEADRWIERSERAREGQGWRRMQYTLTTPPADTVGNHVPHLHGEGDSRHPTDNPGNAERDVGKLVRNVGNPTTERGECGSPEYSMTPPVNPPSNSPSAELRSGADGPDGPPARPVVKRDNVVEATAEAIENRRVGHLLGMLNMIPRDAQWVVDGAHQACANNVTDGAGMYDAYYLAAEVMYDMRRKGTMFSRDTFLSWMEQLIKIRARDPADVEDVCEVAREVWKVGRRLAA
jgi:hypothetical protein